MSGIKRITALSVASIMAVSMAGCTDMSKIMTVDDVDVNAGIYINYMLAEYTEQMYTLYYSGVTSDYMDQEIENDEGETVKLKEYLPDYAYESTVDLVAINKHFDKLGLEMSTEDTQEVNDAVKNYVDSMTEDYLAEQGISKDSVTKYFTAEKQKQLIFNYYYGADGEKAVSNDDIKNYLKENYLRYKIISISRTTEATTAASTSSEDETTTTQSAEEQTKASKKADKEAKALAKKYLKLAKENDNFDEVISQYNAETEETTAVTTAAEASEDAVTDSTSETDTTVAAEVSENADNSDSTSEAQTTTTTTVDEDKEYAVKFYDANQNEYEEGTPQQAQTVKSGETAERPDDPEKEFYIFDDWYTDTSASNLFDFSTAITADTAVYANFTTNEVMLDYSDEDNVSDLRNYISEKIKFNKPTLYKDDNYYYVIVKYDPTERTDYLIDGDSYEDILTEMKYEEYDELIKSWEKDFKITKNAKAFKKYTPSKLEEIQNDYTAES